MERETWVGIAWAVGLVLAMAGVFAYEAATFELDEFEVSGSEESLLTEAATLSEGASDEYQITFDASGALAVGARVTWTDDVGNDDAFEVTIDAGDLRASDSGASGSLAATVELADATPGTYEAVDEQHAIDQASGDDAPSGEQTWTLTVHLRSAPGTAGPGGLPIGATADGGNQYTIEFFVERLTAEVVA